MSNINILKDIEIVLKNKGGDKKGALFDRFQSNMISTTNRVFDYFTTIGIEDKLLDNSNSDESSKQELLR